MIKLNVYINEAWSGMKQHALKSDIEAWCDKMGIENYTINSQGEIDVDGDAWLDMDNKGFKELPYKFGKVNGHFSLSHNKNLISLKNCPDEVYSSFDVDDCSQLRSLKGCPKKVGGDFWGSGCKQKFTQKEVRSLCKVKGSIFV